MRKKIQENTLSKQYKYENTIRNRILELYRKLIKTFNWFHGAYSRKHFLKKKCININITLLIQNYGSKNFFGVLAASKMALNKPHLLLFTPLYIPLSHFAGFRRVTNRPWMFLSILGSGNKIHHGFHFGQIPCISWISLLSGSQLLCYDVA